MLFRLYYKLNITTLPHSIKQHTLFTTALFTVSIFKFKFLKNKFGVLNFYFYICTVIQTQILPFFDHGYR